MYTQYQRSKVRKIVRKLCGDRLLGMENIRGLYLGISVSTKKMKDIRILTGFVSYNEEGLEKQIQELLDAA